MATVKKIVISSNNAARARALFAEVKAKKEAAFIRIEARTRGVVESLMKQANGVIS